AEKDLENNPVIFLTYNNKLLRSSNLNPETL
ncbi:MAG: hypothetical protein QG578_2132, partial [Thermodesulfobacteriota bacterium]|nr:hypothetical protein [Thermodesulfobacteriota bacterium]